MYAMEEDYDRRQSVPKALKNSLGSKKGGIRWKSVVHAYLS